MPTIKVTEDTFEQTITSPGIVLVDFWAGWCGPCLRFAPVFEAAAEQHPDIIFAKVDTEAEARLSRALGIRSIPTLMIFRDGIQLFEQPGALPATALQQLITSVQAVDMADVRKQLAQQSRTT